MNEENRAQNSERKEPKKQIVLELSAYEVDITADGVQQNRKELEKRRFIVPKDILAVCKIRRDLRVFSKDLEFLLMYEKLLNEDVEEGKVIYATECYEEPEKAETVSN